jgi:valyl-tRNA synthetase
MPFITEEIWHAMYDGKPPLKSIALAAYPAADEKQIDLARGNGDGDSAGFDRQRAQSAGGIESRAQGQSSDRGVCATSRRFARCWRTNLGAVLLDRPANVEKITFVERSLANLPGARSTSRFDVHAIYEKKIDVAAERERLTKELEKIEKQLGGAQRQLGDEQFLSKAPAHVVEGLRKQVEELRFCGRRFGKVKELGKLGRWLVVGGQSTAQFRLRETTLLTRMPLTD